MRTIHFEGFITLADDTRLAHVTCSYIEATITDEITSNLESVWPDAKVTVLSDAINPSANGLPTPSSEPSDRG